MRRLAAKERQRGGRCAVGEPSSRRAETERGVGGEAADSTCTCEVESGQGRAQDVALET